MANNQALPPGPKGLPIVGSTLQFRRDPLHFVREMQQLYGQMATIHFGKIPVVPQPRVTLRPKYGMRMILEATPVEVPTQVG